MLFRSSFILDPGPIIERAHAVGAQVVLDASQSAGIIPVNVTALGVDFATGGCLKWLCGGPGNAFLYTRPDLLRSVQAAAHGLVRAQAEPFAFNLDGVRASCGCAPDDERHAVDPCLVHSAAWIAHSARGVGISVACARVRRHSPRHLLDAGGSARVPDNRDARRYAAGWHGSPGHPRRAAGAARTLNARDYIIDYRPGVGIRVSPHFYNNGGRGGPTDGEALARIVAAKDYVPHRSASVVT